MPKKLNTYDDLRQSLADAAAYERGKAVNLRVTNIPAPPKAPKAAKIKHH